MSRLSYRRVRRKAATVPSVSAGDGAGVPAERLIRATPVTFVVLGAPATKGSVVSFVGKGGRVVTRADCPGLGAWTQAVGWAARAAGIPLATRETPVHLEAVFQFVRPASQRRRRQAVVRPDLDKLTRALLDALTGVAYVDDAQVVRLQVDKAYGADARTWVRVGCVP